MKTYKFNKFTLLLTMALVFSAVITAKPQSQEDLRDRVAATYLSQVGVTEATGNNDGVMVETYLASTGLVKGAPWCAAFVNWTFEQNGIKGPDRLKAFSPSWFPQDRAINSPPKRADIFGIYYSSKGRIAHVGFIDSWHNSYVYTVEGNTNDEGSRDGGAVLRKRRLTRQIYATCDWITYRRSGNG